MNYRVFMRIGLISLLLFPWNAWGQSAEKIYIAIDGDAYIINADGTGLVNLTNTPNRAEWRFNLSPDRQRIVYRAAENPHSIWVENIDGTNPIQLTQGGISNEWPAWSPDGTKIAFCRLAEEADPDSLIGNNWDLFIMNADGSDLRILEVLPLPVRGPIAWSPDGSRIAYSARNLFYIDVESKKTIQLTTDISDLYDKPAWSPDGSQIAFSSTRDGNREIYIIDSDSSNLVRLTDHPDIDDFPCWSPDGRRIAFTSCRDEGTACAVYVVNRDGTNLQLLSNEIGTCLAWLVDDISTAIPLRSWGRLKHQLK
jgi:Tol biopolymer transport system component